jgi:hypothetical protein
VTDPDPSQKPDRLVLPRDAFRSQRIGAVSPGPQAVAPVVVTPSYADVVEPRSRSDAASAAVGMVASTGKAKRSLRQTREANPFKAYGERSSSHPYALRFPETIDLALRQIAAEQHTHPLRIIDRLLYDHLDRLGRLPPAVGN